MALQNREKINHELLIYKLEDAVESVRQSVDAALYALERQLKYGTWTDNIDAAAVHNSAAQKKLGKILKFLQQQV